MRLITYLFSTLLICSVSWAQTSNQIYRPQQKHVLKKPIIVTPKKNFTYSGIKYTVIGKPDVITKKNGDIYIRSFGKSSSNGVSINVAPTSFFQYDYYGELEASKNPPGSLIQFAVKDINGRTISSVIAKNIKNSYLHSFNFRPIGSYTFGAIVKNKGKVVANLKGYNGNISLTIPTPDNQVVRIIPSGDLCLMFMWDTPQPIGFKNRRVVYGTSMMITSENGRTLAPGSLGGFYIIGKNINPITISDLRVAKK